MSTPFECQESMGRGRASASSFVNRRKDGKVAGPHLALRIILSKGGMGKEAGRTGKGGGENWLWKREGLIVKIKFFFTLFKV